MAVPGVQALWPDTLAKFWGLHAIAWSATGVSLAVRGLRGAATSAGGGADALLCAGAATLAGANLAVSVLLYRTDEEAGATLAAAAALWFASATAVLQAATKLALSGGAARLVRSLRLWHVAMALGSCVFVAKARSKDRLFAQSEELLRRGSARGAALPLLVVVNQGA